jgi:hypothetical protein
VEEEESSRESVSPSLVAAVVAPSGTQIAALPPQS